LEPEGHPVIIQAEKAPEEQFRDLDLVANLDLVVNHLAMDLDLLLDL